MNLLRAPLALGCAVAIATPIALVTTPSFGQRLATKLLAPDGAADDYFGLPVAVGGSRVIVGSPRDDDNGPFSGAAYIFRPHGPGWLPEAKLLAPDGTAGDLFGLKVAISGKVAVCGADTDDALGIDSGSVYVFRRRGSQWVPEAHLVAPDGTGGDRFGVSVAVDQELIVVGAFGDDELGSSAGAAHIFRFDGTAWTPEAKLLASDGSPGSLFGRSVAISGTTVVVGADEQDTQGPDAGAVYVFTRVGNQWVQQARLLAADGSAGDRFGAAVAAGTDTVLVGARFHDGVAENAGAAYLFRRHADGWVQEAQFLPAEGDIGDRFGVSVALRDRMVLVGADLDDDRGVNAGAAYLFRHHPSGWVQSAKLVAGDGADQDNFGRSVAVGAGIVVVGSPLDDDLGPESGSVYVFAGHRGAVSCPGDVNGDQVVDVLDLIAVLTSWGPSLGVRPADVNRDGVVNGQDLVVIVHRWGNCD
jgi:hypothetical protein